MIEREPAADESGLLQLRADLDRLMQSNGLREARDIVAANPRLTGLEVAAFLSEAIKRTRQLGEVVFAESCEHWLALLRRFREFGVEAGYLESVIDDLARARDAQAHGQVLRDHPELKDAATLAYLDRRAKEAGDVADVAARDKYRFVRSIVQTTEIVSLEPGQSDPTEAISAFAAGFVQEADATACRRLLEAHAEMLRPPLAVLVGAMFGPFIERARALNALVSLRDLLLRQALFTRCQEVGIEQAFDELARGVPWKQLTGKR
jgi:hypothetical protein